METSNGRSDEELPSPKAPSFLAVNKNAGKVVWQDNSPGDADGDLAVFKASSEMKKPAVIDMADSVYSTPVPANGVLYVMTRTRLYAITANKSGAGKYQELGTSRSGEEKSDTFFNNVLFKRGLIHEDQDTTHIDDLRAFYRGLRVFRGLATVLWTEPRISVHFYTQYTTNEQRDGLVSMSMSGEVKWKTGQSPAFIRGGMILVDGLLLATDGSKKLFLIEPDPAGFKTLASAELMEAGNNWAPLALSDGKLLIRDQKKLIVVQVGQ